MDKVKELVLRQAEELYEGGTVRYVFFTLALGCFVMHKLSTRRKSRLPPGPTAWPLIGNLLSLRTLHETNKSLARWRKQFGDVFTIYVGRQPCIVLATADKIREALMTKGHDFDGRIHFPSCELIAEGKDIGFSQPGPGLKLQRQIAQNALRKYVLGANLERNVEMAVQSLVSAIKERPRKVMDLPADLYKMMFNFMASACFGHQFEHNDPWLAKFEKNFHKTAKKVGRGFVSDIFPALKFLDKGKIEMLGNLTTELDTMLQKEFEEHKQNLDPEHPKDLVDEILVQIQKLEESRDKSKHAKLGPEHLRSILKDVFAGKSLLPKAALGVVIGHLMDHPKIQAKVHQELDAVIGTSGKVTLRNKDQLNYLNAVIHESMRVVTAAPLGFPHATTKDTTLGQYNIPRDTMVLTHLQGVHHDPNNFEHPEEFKPDRWLDENGKFQRQLNKFVAFSVGTRQCIGESLARAELQMFIAMLFHKFQFRAIDGKVSTLKVNQLTVAIELEAFQAELLERQ